MNSTSLLIVIILLLVISISVYLIYKLNNKKERFYSTFASNPPVDPVTAKTIGEQVFIGKELYLGNAMLVPPLPNGDCQGLDSKSCGSAGLYLQDTEGSSWQSSTQLWVQSEGVKPAKLVVSVPPLQHGVYATINVNDVNGQQGTTISSSGIDILSENGQTVNTNFSLTSPDADSTATIRAGGSATLNVTDGYGTSTLTSNYLSTGAIILTSVLNSKAPTSSNAGALGELWLSYGSVNNGIWVCTAVSGSTYTWSKIV